MQQRELKLLTQKILGGLRLTENDDLSFLLTSPLPKLMTAAKELQHHFRQNKLSLCSIINAKNGNCSENCRYCAQAACHQTNISAYSFLPAEKILPHAQKAEAAGIRRLALVTSGRGLKGKDFTAALEIYQKLSTHSQLHLCASHGIIDLASLQALKEAGVSRYHHNLETSRRFFPKICTSHTYDERIQTIKNALQAGLEVCSGGIFGLGETWQDRLDMALELAKLKIKSIPLNILTPIPGTPLEKNQPLQAEEIMRIICIFRLLNPEADIRLAAGRSRLPDKGLAAFKHGASAAIAGDMLTTAGTALKDDLAMLQREGFSLI